MFSKPCLVPQSCNLGASSSSPPPPPQSAPQKRLRKKNIKMHQNSTSRGRVSNFQFSKCSKFLLFATQDSLFKATLNGQVVSKYEIPNILKIELKNENQVYLLSKERILLFDFVLGIEIQSTRNQGFNDVLFVDNVLYLISSNEIYALTAPNLTLTAETLPVENGGENQVGKNIMAGLNLVFATRMEINSVLVKGSKFYIKHMWIRVKIRRN